MFGLFNRSKNTVKSPKTLLVSIGIPEETLFDSDRDIYQSYFSDITEYQAETVSDFFNFISDKHFDIVHLFTDVLLNGTIQNASGYYFLENLSEAKTKLVIFASDNPADCYIAFYPKSHDNSIKPMNAILTIERKGELFPKFFKSLFELMANGDTMPQAWVKLAPQNPHANAAEATMPGAIFIAGFASVKFVP